MKPGVSNSHSVLVAGHPQRHRRIHQHAEDAHDEAYDHRPPTTLGVQPLEEDAEEEDDEDRRRQISLNGLQILVETAGVFQDGQPGQGDQHHDARGDSARPHDLVLRGLGFPLPVEVDRKERRASVEDAGQRAHQGGEQTGNDNAAQPLREHVQDHQREGPLRRGTAGLAPWTIAANSGTLPDLAKRERDQTGNDEQVDGKQLQEGGKDAAPPGRLFVRRAQGPLHDVLVGTPVPEADHRGANRHRQPGEAVVEVPCLTHDIARRILVQHRRPGPIHTLGDERFPKVEHVGPAGLAEIVPADAQSLPIAQ